VTAQQADLAARDIVARALGREAPEPHAPVLRGMLLTGESRLWLQRDLDGDDPGQSADYALWWPPSKIAGVHLAPYLDELPAAEPDRAPEVPLAIEPAGEPSTRIWI
jgi:sulfide:quinone oxidoreductase